MQYYVKMFLITVEPPNCSNKELWVRETRDKVLWSEIFDASEWKFLISWKLECSFKVISAWEWLWESETPESDLAHCSCLPVCHINIVLLRDKRKHQHRQTFKKITRSVQPVIKIHLTLFVVEGVEDDRATSDIDICIPLYRKVRESFMITLGLLDKIFYKRCCLKSYKNTRYLDIELVLDIFQIHEA